MKQRGRERDLRRETAIAAGIYYASETYKRSQIRSIIFRAKSPRTETKSMVREEREAELGRVSSRAAAWETNGGHLKLSQVKNRKLQSAWKIVSSTTRIRRCKDTMKDMPSSMAEKGREESERKTLCAGIPHNNFTDNEYIGEMRQHTHTAWQKEFK